MLCIELLLVEYVILHHKQSRTILGLNLNVLMEIHVTERK